MSIFRRKVLMLGLIPLALGGTQTYAESSYPAKPVKILVGYPAGQTVDLIARNFAAALTKEMGQTFFVDNRAGANGIIGADEVKRSSPDGYTLLFATSGQLAINPSLYKQLPYNTIKDFAPVSLVSKGPLYLIANPSFPPNTVPELIAYAKSRPADINYGSGGNGITAHLAMELFQAAANIKLTHVPYKGSGAALNDLMGGRISLMFDAGASALPHVKSGKLKVLGMTAQQRNTTLLNVPTIAEQGLSGFEVTSWVGILAPAGTPDAVINKLNAAIIKVASTPSIADSIHSTGGDLALSTPGQFSNFLQAELKKWAKAVEAGNVKID